MYKRFILLVLITNLTACEKWALRQAEQADSMAAYTEFLAKYPTGENAERIRLLIEDKILASAKIENTVKAFDGYLQRYPEGRYKDEVAKLRQQAFYNDSLASNTFESLTDYIHAYPQDAAKVEQRLFLLSLQKHDDASYQKFIHYFGNSEWLPIVTAQQKLLNEEARITNALKGANEQQKAELQNQLRQAMWQHSDFLSLDLMTALLDRTQDAELRKKILSKAQALIDNFQWLLREQRVAVEQVSNKQQLSKAFQLPLATSVYVIQTGEKADNRSIDTMSSGLHWLDHGTLSQGGKSLLTLDQGFPAGGAFAQRSIMQQLQLQAGDYTLSYSTDAGMAWGDFGSAAPATGQWGIAVYFVDVTGDTIELMQNLLAVFSKSELQPQFEAILTLASNAHPGNSELAETLYVATPHFADAKQSEDVKDLQQITTQHAKSPWKDVLHHVIYQKKLLQQYKDVLLSTPQMNPGQINIQAAGWLQKATEAENLTANYDSAQSMQQAAAAGRLKPFSKVNARNFYVTGYVENTSDTKSYDVNVRCDFNFKSTSSSGIWWFRSKSSSLSLRSAYFAMPGLQPGEKRPYACKVASGSGSAFKLGIFGGSSSSYVEEWQVQIAPLGSGQHTTDLKKQQLALLAEAGIDPKLFQDPKAVAPASLAMQLPGEKLDVAAP